MGGFVIAIFAVSALLLSRYGRRLLAVAAMLTAALGLIAWVAIAWNHAQERKAEIADAATARQANDVAPVVTAPAPLYIKPVVTQPTPSPSAPPAEKYLSDAEVFGDAAQRSATPAPAVPSNEELTKASIASRTQQSAPTSPNDGSPPQQ